MRHRKTDAHIATIRVSVPIMPTDWRTIVAANEAINGLSAHLPPGSTVEVLNSRFGRVDAPQIMTTTAPAMIEPQQLSVRLPDGSSIPFNELGKTDRDSLPPVKTGPLGAIAATQLDIEHAITAGAVDQLDPPESLRRVPRPASNGG